MSARVATLWRVAEAPTRYGAAVCLAAPRAFSTEAGTPGGGGAAPSSTSSAAAAAGADGAGTTGVSAHDMGDYTNIPSPRLVVFGGNGYVGSRVCQEGLDMGLAVTSISRRGRPRSLRGEWIEHVEWVRGDALDPQQPWRDALRGSLGVISTLGAFGSNDFMYKVCGTANIRAMEAAKEAGVPRFCFISVHDYKLPTGWQAQGFLLRGYFQGKRDAEQALARIYPEGGVALRPSAISGTRVVGASSLPLWAVLGPMKAVLSVLPVHSLSNLPIVGAVFTPPVKVEAVAKAAVAAVLDPSVPPGPMDLWTILEYEK